MEGHICFLSPWLTRVVEEGLLGMEDYVVFLISDVDVAGSELQCCVKKVNRDRAVKIDHVESDERLSLFMLYATEPV